MGHRGAGGFWLVDQPPSALLPLLLPLVPPLLGCGMPQASRSAAVGVQPFAQSCGIVPASVHVQDAAGQSHVMSRPPDGHDQVSA